MFDPYFEKALVEIVEILLGQQKQSQINLFLSRMSNSACVRQLNSLLGQKVRNNCQVRSPHNRSTINMSLANRPFSRKPLNQTDNSSNQNIPKDYHKQLNIGLMDESLQDEKSVTSARNSGRQVKFMRTNKIGVVSPSVKNISKSKSREKSISVNQSMASQRNTLKCFKSENGNTHNKKVFGNQDSVSQFLEEYIQIHLKKSTSSQCLINKSQTRTMVVPNLDETVVKRSFSKQNKDILETSVYTFCNSSQNLEKNKLQRTINQLKQQNEEIKNKCRRLEEQNGKINREKIDLKIEVGQLSKKIKDLQACKVEIKNFSEPTNKSLSFVSLTRVKSPNSKSILSPHSQQTYICKKCQQKQSSSKKHIAYLQNIIKKRQLQISTMKKDLTNLKSENSQISLKLQQATARLLQVQEHSGKTEQRLSECITEFKQDISKLRDQLRYLKIENSVLLKIKNENLKLKIDITKIQDQKDYFKMKVLEINKKNCGMFVSPTVHCKFLGKKCQMGYNKKDKGVFGKRGNNTHEKGFHTDYWTETEDDAVEMSWKRNKGKCKTDFYQSNSIDGQGKNNKQTDTETGIFSDPLFELSSQSENN